MAVGLEAIAPPFPQPAHRLDPGDQQQRGQQVDTQVDAALGGQVSKVAEQAGATQHKYTPEVVVSEEDPGGQIAGEPSETHQGKGEGVPVDVDTARFGGLKPQV